jgi:sec-independent protein translocase protein TatB
VFDGVGWAEIVVLLLIGLFVFGPEKLPKAARDAGRLLRQLRQMATGVRNDIRSELGPEFADFDIRTLHPRTFVRKHLMEEDDPLFPSYLSKRDFDRALFDDLDDPPSLTKDFGRTGDFSRPGGTSSASLADPLVKRSVSMIKASAGGKASLADANAVPSRSEQRDQAASATPFDPDAT